MELNKIHEGCALEVLKTFADKSVQCITTSPPYYGLRNYSVRKTIWPEVKYFLFDFEIIIPEMECCLGLEETPKQFIGHLILIFRECYRVLRQDGTLWLNIGDTYAAYWGQKYGQGQSLSGTRENNGSAPPAKKSPVFSKSKRDVDIYGGGNVPAVADVKPKDLFGIPWMLSFALRNDGWYLRQDNIWCLSGGAYIYVRSQKGDSPMMVKDMVRLNAESIKLWNGEKWTQVLGWNRNTEGENNKEIVLRSGERIGCTDNHVWPIQTGNVPTKELRIGDVIKSCKLPEPENRFTPNYLTEDILWLIGLYLAEGSRNGSALQIAGHIKEESRLERVKRVADHFGGSITYTKNRNNLEIRIYGKIIRAIIFQFISGNTAYDKGLSNSVWKLQNSSLKTIIEGYLSGDAHNDILNERWRLGFCRNYNLERDLRTAAARLGAILTLNPSIASNQTGKFPSFRGEWRWLQSGHFNQKDRGEVIEIRNSRARKFWDIEVQDEPHLFALASGVLTHNSKPNPMPESVTDRCTKSHEYIFLLSKSAKYYYNAYSIATEYQDKTLTTFGCDVKGNGDGSGLIQSENWANTIEVRKPKVWKTPDGWDTDNGSHGSFHKEGRENGRKNYEHRGKHDKKLNGHSGNFDLNGDLIGTGKANKRSVWTVTTMPYSEAHFATFPERLIVDMIKAGCPEGGIVLDPFAGSCTTPLVARKLNRNFVAIELNPGYIKLGEERLRKELGLFI